MYLFEKKAIFWFYTQWLVFGPSIAKTNIVTSQCLQFVNFGLTSKKQSRMVQEAPRSIPNPLQNIDAINKKNIHPIELSTIA